MRRLAPAKPPATLEAPRVGRATAAKTVALEEGEVVLADVA